MTEKTGVVGVPAEPTEQVLNALFEIANDIHGEIDKQTYDEKRAAEWDLPEDHAFGVRITQAQDHALNKAILLVEKHRAALAAPPSPLPAPVEPTAVKQVLEWYRDEVLALSIHTANRNTSAVMAGMHVLTLDAGNRAITALCHPALNPKRPVEGKSP